MPPPAKEYRPWFPRSPIHAITKILGARLGFSSQVTQIRGAAISRLLSELRRKPVYVHLVVLVVRPWSDHDTRGRASRSTERYIADSCPACRARSRLNLGKGHRESFYPLGECDEAYRFCFFPNVRLRAVRFLRLRTCLRRQVRLYQCQY